MSPVNRFTDYCQWLLTVRPADERAGRDIPNPSATVTGARIDRIAISYWRVARINKVSPPTDTPLAPMRSASLERSSVAFSAARTRWFE
jgi:hypothetical protein